MSIPRIYDAVLGGNCPPSGAMVLGGTGKLYGKLFDRFNSEAKACNKHYFRLQLTPEVALVRQRKSMPLSDIKIKVLKTTTYENTLHYGLTYSDSYWEFAGYLKHDGPLLGRTATYDPHRCEVALREIVQRALRGGR